MWGNVPQYNGLRTYSLGSNVVNVLLVDNIPVCFNTGTLSKVVANAGIILSEISVSKRFSHSLALGCFECCIKCLGGVPYASLVATILCFSGVALFCGCGHVALTGTEKIVQTYISTNFGDHALLTDIIQLMQYVIYGIASFFFLYGIILLAEGFYTTSAVKEIHGEFKTTACGRCISGMFVFLTYVLGVAWLGVFGFSAVPVFMYYNMWSACQTINFQSVNLTTPIDQICVDIRQYGIVPWNASPGKACGSFLIENTSTGATVIALLIYMMATTYNYAVLKFKSREDCCTKF
uniref:Glycoprotein M6Ba n=1 Tax=Callorhinchus milii TaxID=7868 RepID=A0A4W3HWU7_CALMI